MSLSLIPGMSESPLSSANRITFPESICLQSCVRACPALESCSELLPMYLNSEHYLQLAQVKSSKKQGLCLAVFILPKACCTLQILIILFPAYLGLVVFFFFFLFPSFPLINHYQKQCTFPRIFSFIITKAKLFQSKHLWRSLNNWRPQHTPVNSL